MESNKLQRDRVPKDVLDQDGGAIKSDPCYAHKGRTKDSAPRNKTNG